MGMFDDLIPAQSSGGMFDDLIPKDAPVTAEGAYRAVDMGVQKGVAGLAGIPKAIGTLGAQGIQGAANYVSRKLGLPEDTRDVTKDGLVKLPTPEEALATIQKDFGGEQYTPRNMTERYLERGGEMLPNALFPGGAAARAANVALPAVGAQTVAEMGGGELAQAAGGLAGATVPTAIANRVGRVTQAYRGAPVADDLGQAVDEGYAALRNSGVEIQPSAVNRAIAGIKARQDIHEDLTPKTWAILNRAQAQTAAREPDAMAALTGTRATQAAAQTFDDLDALRRRLGAIARDYSNPTEAAAARAAQRGLDDFMADAFPGAGATRANAAAEFRLRAMDALRQRAEDQAASAASGMNVENAYRQQLRAFIRPNNKGVSPAQKEGFTQQEINMLRVATHSSSFPNMLRLVGNMLGGGHGLMAGAGAGATLATGDPTYLAAVGAGHGMRRLSNAMMRNRADMLGRMTAARSPLAQRMNVVGPARPASIAATVPRGLMGSDLLAQPVPLAPPTWQSR